MITGPNRYSISLDYSIRMAATVFGLDPASSVILIIAVLGVVPVIKYYEKTYVWFVYAYACLFVAAFATNVEDLLLPEVLNLTEHFVGNLGAGLAFAAGAYFYRKEHIDAEVEADVAEEI